MEMKRAIARAGILAVVLSAALSPATAAEPPRLSLPIGCAIGPGCQIQNFADNDTGAGVRDFACGLRSYDGHKGTDFRIRDAAAMAGGVKVLAAAAGIVKAIRDEMPDIAVRDAADVAGRECGNGVVLEHGGGWVTQYCHLRKGSVRVKPGETVAQDGVLSEVGMSGFAEFAHLHFEVRKDETIVDPFTGEALGAASETCGAGGAHALWDAKTLAALAYKPAAFLSAGFAAGPVTLKAAALAPPPAPTSASPALVAYVRVLGVRAGDMETLSVTDPAGEAFGAKGPMAIAAPKAEWLSFFGRKRGPSPWPKGEYRATYRLERAGAVLVQEDFSVRVQ